MTRKDFVLIAAVLLENRENLTKPVHNRLVLDMMQALARTNNAFNHRRFEEACGFWSNLNINE